ncbi:hypothetical protein N9B90_00600 [bacterium]|nr:hypothetical protein [bacterium]
MIHPHRGLVSCCALVMLTSCVAKPDRDDKGFMVSAQRVLALEFGVSAAGSRQARLTSLPSAVASEITRASKSLGQNHEHSVGSAIGSEFRRVGRVADLGAQFFGAELTRHPHKFDGVWPSSFEFEQNTADGFQTAVWLLGPSQHALGEISDYKHRTDHDDKRPEATFWQRLRRRLPF